MQENKASFAITNKNKKVKKKPHKDFRYHNIKYMC